MRRLFALYALFFAARAFGAELIRPAVAPVQLSFSFAAPAALVPLTAMTPVISAAALEAAPTFMPAVLPIAAPAPIVAAAAAAAPAQAEVTAAIPAAIAPPIRSAPAVANGDEGDGGRAQLRRLAQGTGGSGAVFDASRRTTKMDYAEFGRQLARRPGLDLNPFNQTDAKRRILAASGYTHLYGAGGARIPLSDASDVRIGRAFLSVKKTFDRRAR